LLILSSVCISLFFLLLGEHSINLFTPDQNVSYPFTSVVRVIQIFCYGVTGMSGIHSCGRKGGGHTF
jgi:hypothetical protein